MLHSTFIVLFAKSNFGSPLGPKCPARKLEKNEHSCFPNDVQFHPYFLPGHFVPSGELGLILANWTIIGDVR